MHIFFYKFTISARMQTNILAQPLQICCPRFSPDKNPGDDRSEKPQPLVGSLLDPLQFANLLLSFEVTRILSEAPSLRSQCLSSRKSEWSWLSNLFLALFFYEFYYFWKSYIRMAAVKLLNFDHLLPAMNGETEFLTLTIAGHQEEQFLWWLNLKAEWDSIHVFTV